MEPITFNPNWRTRVKVHVPEKKEANFRKRSKGRQLSLSPQNRVLLTFSVSRAKQLNVRCILHSISKFNKMGIKI